MTELFLAVEFGRPLIAGGWHVGDANGALIDGDMQRAETAEAAVRLALGSDRCRSLWYRACVAPHGADRVTGLLHRRRLAAGRTIN
jgi:hypothetical protein